MNDIDIALIKEILNVDRVDETPMEGGSKVTIIDGDFSGKIVVRDGEGGSDINLVICLTHIKRKYERFSLEGVEDE